MRVLHLVDPGSPGGGACTLRLIVEAMERIPSVTQRVLVVGNAAHAALAARCGLKPAGRVSPPAGATALARRAVARALPILEREHGRFDVVQAWTANAATLATLVAGDRHRLGVLPIGPLDGIETEAFGTLMEQHPMPLLALGATIRHEHAIAGIDPDLLFVLPPGINHDVLPDDRALARAEIRRRWGVGSEAFVVGLLGEPVRWADARAATAVLSLVALAGHDVVLVLHPSAQRRFEAQRYAESLGIGARIVLEERIAEPWRMVVGLDAALLMSDETTSDRPRRLGSPLGMLLGGGRPRRPMTGTMSLLWAAAAGVPVVAEGTLAARAFVEEGITGFLVGSRDIYRAANRLVRLVEDRQLAGRVGAAAAAHVRKCDDVSGFCVRLKTVWQRLCEDRPMLILNDPSREVLEFVPPGRRSARLEADVLGQR